MPAPASASASSSSALPTTAFSPSLRACSTLAWLRSISVTRASVRSRNPYWSIQVSLKILERYARPPSGRITATSASGSGIPRATSIAAAATGTHVGDIGAAVEDYVRKASGHRFGILEEYVGHGIGSKMHMAPDVLNFRSTDRGPRLRAGMALAIEPMLVRGGIGTRVLDDEWTVVTTDGARSSQWEHSVALHADGVWVLTAEDGGASELEPLGVRPVPIPEDLP